MPRLGKTNADGTSGEVNVKAHIIHVGSVPSASGPTVPTGGLTFAYLHVLIEARARPTLMLQGKAAGSIQLDLGWIRNRPVQLLGRQTGASFSSGAFGPGCES